eukprot:scpid47628/ scgid19040/ 
MLARAACSPVCGTEEQYNVACQQDQDSAGRPRRRRCRGQWWWYMYLGEKRAMLLIMVISCMHWWSSTDTGDGDRAAATLALYKYYPDKMELHRHNITDRDQLAKRHWNASRTRKTEHGVSQQHPREKGALLKVKACADSSPDKEGTAKASDQELSSLELACVAISALLVVCVAIVMPLSAAWLSYRMTQPLPGTAHRNHTTHHGSQCAG